MGEKGRRASKIGEGEVQETSVMRLFWYASFPLEEDRRGLTEPGKSTLAS